MSKINAIRLINLNYNNNAIKISDETFHLNGDSTLLSLRNGGGKSVLVQMMTAPFVHKRYRDAKDRPFESYFTGGKPTFILVEWVLDQGAGYVLTGMMVRRSQDISGEENGPREELEIINLISEYKEPCIQDIHHLPVLEKTKKEITLKNFGVCRQLFEVWKRDKSTVFFYYDMNNQSQSRQYFEKLREYQIDYREWETIIKKVNLKESGLSDLFADCRDEKGLVEKWFLDAVESKLNRDKNRMKEFQNIIEKYVEQYKDNRSKIERRDTIRRFQEEGEKISADALACGSAIKLVRYNENQIAGFRNELTLLRDAEEAAKEAVTRKLRDLQEQREYLVYKKLSGEYYELEKRERFHSSNRDMIDFERESLEKECGELRERLHLLECAKRQGEADEDNRALLEASERLDISKKRGESLEPERQKLGSTLKRFWQEECEAWEEKQGQNTERQQEAQKALTEETGRLEGFQDQIVEFASKIAEQKTKIAVFDGRETRFNNLYNEDLARNILGEYEPGALNIRRQMYETALEALSKERIGAKRRLDIQAEEKRSLERKLEDLRQELVRNGEQQRELLRIRDELETELSERKTILRYLELSETQVFERETILSAIQRKLTDIQRVRRELEQEEEQQQKEYDRLTQGKVLELPKEFETMLGELGIRCVYGMEWLRKNGRSAGENQELVKRHPFLPYSLILSKRELKLMTDHMGKEDGKEVFTSFPVPMMLRDQLEEERSAENGAVLEYGRIHFYVYFNKNLLNEEALKRMAGDKKRLIDKLRASVLQKQEEYQEYFEKKEKIRNQRLTESVFQENRQRLKESGQHKQILKENAETAAGQIRILEEQTESGKRRIQELENEERRQRQKLKDFQEFSAEYDDYLEDHRVLERSEKKGRSLKEQKGLCEERIEGLRRRIKTLENTASDLREKLRLFREKRLLYDDFSGTEYLEGEAGALEARYMAITAGLSVEQQELEQRVRECRKRAVRSADELKWLRDKYNLAEGAWREILYNREEERRQESFLEERERKKKQKDSQWIEEDKKTDLLRQEMKQKKQRMLEDCGRNEPIPKQDIVAGDIEARMNELAWQETEAMKQEELHLKKVISYDNNLTSLAEYNDLEQREEINWEQDFSQMTRKQLDDFKGGMVREYRSAVENSRELHVRLTSQLHRILRIEAFREDFYRKPLEAMLELSKDASQVLAQLDTTVHSYRSLMEKLEVDISIVEKEKTRIAELLEDYLKDVHENMGKIDHNSTITVRNRPVKMLKIDLPGWEENLSLYQLRIGDFLDELTKKGIERFERNENAQEYFGVQLTTKNLYDTVLGIANVQIHLFKIEEQREYSITWTDVAKNSGGEGFLSAFVILSSLLYYMRRDDSDFFADRNEGKVLVMDNPFAQTNAVHLLKPLMDMAKKTNTQLICLSGLGGESIYNRFDNIYVLNLIAAGLRNSVQYLRTDHIKGLEAETVIASRIQVAEQMEMMF